MLTLIHAPRVLWVKELLAVGEYELSEDVNDLEAAGYMILANTVMNFDEFVMKR